ncbi:MAG: hypothetical protein QOE56_1723 [Solirubrobacterales bacterium]|jgi:hypothetical protein|nr:hypothetical protein [Solirubrobacterales bacterium]
MGSDAPRRIEAVAPLGDADREVLADVREVLAKHGALDRFALTLLHSHFDLRDDEVLVEVVDASTRTLTIRPRPEGDQRVLGDPIETSWRLDSPSGEPVCVLYCYRPKGSTFHEI